MDDLTMLRDLGRDLEHEPSAGLARQRIRLLDEAAGGRRRRLTRFTGGRRTGWIALAAVTDRRPTSARVGDLGERSDLMVLLRLSADRKRATAPTSPASSGTRP